MVPLCLVYRSGKGCRQYAFFDIGEFRKWCARHPYKTETLLVIVLRESREVSRAWIAADRAGDYLEAQYVS